MRRSSSLSVLVTAESTQTYILDDEDTDFTDVDSTSKNTFSEEPVPSTSIDHHQGHQDDKPQAPGFRLRNPSSKNEIDIDPPNDPQQQEEDEDYKPPPPLSSTSSGYSTGGRVTASTILAHQYYSAQLRKQKWSMQGNNSPKMSPDDSNANLQRYSSLGFGVDPLDWIKRDHELVNTLNASNNNNAMIAYPAKLIKMPKSPGKATTADQKQKTPPPAPVAEAPPPKPVKSKPTVSKAPAQEESATSKALKKTAPAEPLTSKASKKTAPQAPAPPKSPPKNNKAASASPSTTKKGKSPPSTKGEAVQDKDKVTFDKQVDQTPHVGHVDSKQKRNIVRRQTGYQPKKGAPVKAETTTDEETDEEPPPPPPEYADDNTSPKKKRDSNSSRKSSGPTIEDDRTGGIRKASLPSSKRSGEGGAFERSSIASGSDKNKPPEEPANSEEPESKKSSAGSQTPPPTQNTAKKSPKESPKASPSPVSSGGGTFIPRTPPQDAQQSSKESAPPPLTPPPEFSDNYNKPQEPPPVQQQQGEEQNLTLPICNCNDAKLVQARLVEMFDTQPRNQCCSCAGGAGGRRPSYQRGGGCCGCSKAPATCFTPCSCQRCRVYHYCFNILNRHTLKPEDMFLGISQYEQSTSNSLYRQNQLNPPPNCPTSHIITNKDEGQQENQQEGQNSNRNSLERSMEPTTGAKNWSSPPDGYQDTKDGGMGGIQDGMGGAKMRLFGDNCREASGMINPWQTEYSAQFKDFSDQIRRSSSKYPSYDEGYGGRFGGGGGGCCGGGQQGRQNRNCFEEANERNKGFGGSYVKIPEEARRIHLLSKLHSCNNNNLDFQCNYIPSNQFCSWMKLRMAVRALRCCEMKRNAGCCQNPKMCCKNCGERGGDGWGGRGRRLASKSGNKGGAAASRSASAGGGRSKSGGRSEKGYNDGYDTQKDFVGGREGRVGGGAREGGGASCSSPTASGNYGGGGCNTVVPGGSSYGKGGTAFSNRSPGANKKQALSSNKGSGGGSGFSDIGVGGGLIFTQDIETGRLKALENVPRQGGNFYGSEVVDSLNNNQGIATNFSCGVGSSSGGGFGGVSNEVSGCLKTLENVPKQNGIFYGSGGGRSSLGEDANNNTYSEETIDTSYEANNENPDADGSCNIFDDFTIPRRLKTLERFYQQTGAFDGTGFRGPADPGEENMIFKASLDDPFHTELKPLEKVPRQTLDLPPKKENQNQKRDPDELFNYYKDKADQWRQDNPNTEQEEQPSSKPKSKPKKKGQKEKGTDEAAEE